MVFRAELGGDCPVLYSVTQMAELCRPCPLCGIDGIGSETNLDVINDPVVVIGSRKEKGAVGSSCPCRPGRC